MPSEEGSDLEERLADRVALCARGECRSLKLADAEPLAMLAALLASEIRSAVLGPSAAALGLPPAAPAGD